MLLAMGVMEIVLLLFVVSLAVLLIIRQNRAAAKFKRSGDELLEYLRRREKSYRERANH